MDKQLSSIQSFYSREVKPVPQGAKSESSSPCRPGDGFTSSEVEAALDPLSHPWKPPRIYESSPISLLESGPRNYQITGRLVNFSLDHQQRGYHLLIVTDGTGTAAIKLYYIKASDYQLVLGQRVTVWATFIADATTASSGSIPFYASSMNIYPGRKTATNIVIHDDLPGSDADRILRCPLECNLTEYNYLPGLMTLKAFMSSGYDMEDGPAKILVCVRSVGPRRAIYSKKLDKNLAVMEIGVFDDTAAGVLKLWEDKIVSAKRWVPSQTVLLISKPTSRAHGASRELGIGQSSMIDVDPDFPDANWLRDKVKGLAKKQSICLPFPSNTWDIGLAIHGPGRTLFTLADVEDQVRLPEPTVDFTGKLNVIITEMKLMENWRKRTVCCIECCGIPLYSNKPTAICRNCESQHDLTLNPRIIGSMVDESGMMATAKLVWHDNAWTQLFFGSMAQEPHLEDGSEANLVEQSWEDLTAFDTNSLRDIEDQLLYSRITLTFGWSSKLERLCILGVEW
ncbi:hypothetical protein GGR54DRAFT_637720 [Hypoxylon sp. NC1633]|nr:hypothetical protein GGR54DRAFT_637720 [Hypoxylon sp. NC1633]